MKVYRKRKQTAATAKVKLAAKYSNRDMEWKSVYSLSFRTTLESKLTHFGKTHLMTMVTSLVIRSSHKHDRPRVFHRPRYPVAPGPRTQPPIIHYTN